MPQSTLSIAHPLEVIRGHYRSRWPWISFIEKYYLLTHMCYITAVSLIGSFVLFYLEPIAYVDALFVAVSCATCTGLSTVDVDGWSTGATIARHILMILGGAVFASAFQPLIRLAVLRAVEKKMADDDAQSETAHLDRRLGVDAEVSSSIALLQTSAKICATATYLYWFCVQGALLIILYFGNVSGMTAASCLQRIVGNFHSCGFMALHQFINDPVAVLTLGWACALGFTFVPVTIRPVIRILHYAFTRSSSFAQHLDVWSDRTHRSMQCAFLLILRDDLPSPPEDRFQEGRSLSVTTEDNSSPEFSALQMQTAVNDETDYFHMFILSARNARYILLSFILINFVQFAPYLWQQMGPTGVLGCVSSTGQQLNVAWSQSMLSRFSGALIIDTTLLTNGHLGILLFAMYVPPLPFVLKEKDQVLRSKYFRGNTKPWFAAIWRAVTSRFLWLFTCTVAICFLDESTLAPQMRAPATSGTQDVWTRTIFEVVSAYSGSGLTLPILGLQSPYSFSGYLSSYSKVILVFLMLFGRHRGLKVTWSVV